MSATLKNIFVAVICLACAGFAYFFISGGESGSALDNSAVRQELLNKTQSFIERSARLQQITIDQSLFTDPTFVSLRSFSTPVPDQPIGKSNIFGNATAITGTVATETEE